MNSTKKKMVATTGKAFRRHLRPQHAGGKAQHPFKDAFHHRLEPPRHHGPLPRAQDEEQDDYDAGEPRRKQGIGNGKLAYAQGSKVVLFLAAALVFGRLTRRGMLGIGGGFLLGFLGIIGIAKAFL